MLETGLLGAKASLRKRKCCESMNCTDGIELTFAKVTAGFKSGSDVSRAYKSVRDQTYEHH